MSEPRQTPASLGGPGAPCASCGAALAADQRYCLNCGARRGGPRVDYREHLNGNGNGAGASAGPGVAKAADPAPATPPPAAPERRQRDYAPLAAAGGIAVLGIMLLIGVLIGRGTGSTESAPPQVVTVPSAQSSGGETAAGGGEGSGGAGAKAKSGKGSGKQGAKKDVVAGGSPDTGNAPVASDDDLQQLQEQSPEEYQESSAKLPDEIATPGKAPPTDGKAPGGGSGGTTIE